jgi:hypothetical protein
LFAAAVDAAPPKEAVSAEDAGHGEKKSRCLPRRPLDIPSPPPLVLSRLVKGPSLMHFVLARRDKDRDRDRDRDRARDRDRDKGRDRDRDRERDRDRDRDKDKEKEKDRERKSSKSKRRSPSPEKKKAKKPKSNWDAMPIPGQAAALTPMQSLAMSGEHVGMHDRRARRLYVGGIPPSSNEIIMRQFFDDCLRQCPDRLQPNHIPPIKSVSIQSKPGQNGFAFVEFSTVDDADMGMCMDGVNFSGATLSVRRPKDYMAIPGRPEQQYNLPCMGGSGSGISTQVPDGPGKSFLGNMPVGLLRTLLHCSYTVIMFSLLSRRSLTALSLLPSFSNVALALGGHDG